MKANLKGGNAIVRLLLAHGEKLGMIAIVGCAGWLLWSAMKVNRFESGKDPATLTSKAQQAEQHIKSFTREKIAEIDQEEMLLADPINVDALKPPRETFSEYWPLQSPLSLPRWVRNRPHTLVAEDLEVNSTRDCGPRQTLSKLNKSA